MSNENETYRPLGRYEKFVCVVCEEEGVNGVDLFSEEEVDIHFRTYHPKIWADYQTKQ